MKETIMGVQVTTLGYESLINAVLTDINNKKKSNIVAINPEKIILANQSEDLKSLLNRASYQIPDGNGVVLASKYKKGLIRERVTGVDLFLRLCKMAEEHNKKVFLYGGKPGVAENASLKLKTSYPKLDIAGVMDGYEKDEDFIKNTINESKADIIFVALGSPRQEIWIEKHMNELHPFIYQGVGGSFDVLSGNIKRAPRFFQAIGLEWFYRLMKEPWRYKRILNVFKFGLKVLTSKS
ncbi:WecB/TagA/CpsF family glycosyltransferase [Metabacillus idriensis]|uniref:WecB/TagA/CpsF family glycosyltransferase n=1 Tax=Metabacillus idriensis TaxID=324768 RepID=UPI001749503D|nr:WecB/TagA/CpsF family glycosyltransferase [Metabacillus idriensis]